MSKKKEKTINDSIKTVKENTLYYSEYHDKYLGLMWGWGQTKKESQHRSMEMYYIKRFT